MRVLGVNCNTSEAHLAVLDDGAVVDGLTERLKPASGVEIGDRLLEFKADVRRALAEIRPAQVLILMPERRQPSASYQGLMPRIVIETLVRVAAAEEQVPLDLVTRERVRAALKIKKGKLDDHVDLAGDPIGKYWKAGRALAALAALTHGSV